MGISPNRIIQIEGEGLLQPAYEPQIPADIRDNETVRVIPPSPPWRPITSADIIEKMAGRSPQDQRYWFFDEAFEREIPSQQWIGDPRQVGQAKLYGSGRGLAPVPDGTVFRFETEKTSITLPDLWSGYGLLIMSERLLDLFHASDRTAVVERRVTLQNSKGTPLAADYYLVDVVTMLPAIDIANSIIDYGGPHLGYQAFLKGYVSSRIRDDIDPDHHVFRQASFVGSGGGRIIVSHEFRRRLDEVSPKLTNVRFDACG